MALVHVLQGPDKGRTFHAPNTAVIIGRASSQIQLSDTGASRRHAELKPDNDVWILRDLNSSNGTFLNGQRLKEPTPLRHGDQIRIGHSLLVFTGRDDADALEPFAQAHDVIDLDASDGESDPTDTIVTACDASDDSLVLQAPETADAVVAWNVVFHVAESIGAIESIDAFLDRVADILFDSLKADRLAILRCDERGVSPEPARVRIRTDGAGTGGRIRTSNRIVQRVLTTREAVLSTNTVAGEPVGAGDPADSTADLGYRSVICAPIFVSGRIDGLIHLDTSMTTRAFTPEQLRLVVAIGRLVGLAVENNELQEARVQNERLAAAGETVAYLSHHIKNVLQGIQSGIDILENSVEREGSERLRTGWSLVRRNLDRIMVLTTNMLTFSTDRSPQFTTVDLNELIDDVLQQSRARAHEKGIDLKLERGDTPHVALDRVGICQVIQNILCNALDAVPEDGGRIHLATRYDDESQVITISVTDNGPGIPPEEHELIFDPFHSSKGHGGTGLGLAAARKIVAEHGGRIDVESAVGNGTTFHVRIPKHPQVKIDPDKTDGIGSGKDNA